MAFIDTMNSDIQRQMAIISTINNHFDEIRVNLTNLNALLTHIELARPNKDAADEFIDRWMQKFL